MEVLTFENLSIKPLPVRVAIMLRHRKIKPIVPKPPNGPFFGTNLHGPSIKKLAIPLEAEITEVANVAMKKGLTLINFKFWPQRQSKICTCGTLSMIGSEMYNLL